MRSRVEFRLTMPGVGSWNGRWSGESRDFLLWRTLTDEEMKAAGMENAVGSWRYAWDDGWCAGVSARIMERGERRAKSAGFSGYEWMVKNILKHGHPRCECEWVPDDQYTTPKETWVRCIHCRAGKLAEATT